MTTNWPYMPDSWADKTDFADTIVAAHVNNLQDAVMAIEQEAYRTYRPDLTPASPSAYDDEFESGALDDKWTAINCSLGSVDLLDTSTNKDCYDPLTFRGLMALQPGRDLTEAGEEAEAAILRQTVSLGTNCKIIVKLNAGLVANAASSSVVLTGLLLSGPSGFNDNDYIGVSFEPVFLSEGMPPIPACLIGYLNINGEGPGPCSLMAPAPLACEYLMILKTGNDYSLWGGNYLGVWTPLTDGAMPDNIRFTNSNPMNQLSLFCYWMLPSTEVNLPNPIATFDFVRYFENNSPLINA